MKKIIGTALLVTSLILGFAQYGSIDCSPRPPKTPHKSAQPSKKHTPPVMRTDSQEQQAQPQRKPPQPPCPVRSRPRE